jgi:hypothetical protein
MVMVTVTVDRWRLSYSPRANCRCLSSTCRNLCFAIKALNTRGTRRIWTNAGRLFHHEQLYFSVHHRKFVELCIVIGAAGQDVADRSCLDLAGFERDTITLYFCDALYPCSIGGDTWCACVSVQRTPRTYVVRPWGFVGCMYV